MTKNKEPIQSKKAWKEEKPSRSVEAKNGGHGIHENMRKMVETFDIVSIAIDDRPRAIIIKIALPT